MSLSVQQLIATLLVDNGSLEPAATLSLRQIASALSARAGALVEPVSLLHSSAVPAHALGGRPADILEPTIRRRFQTGTREFRLIPLFFGPSAALTDYLPKVARRLSSDLPGLQITVAPPVIDDATDDRIARVLAERVRSTAARWCRRRPAVVLVDHGSPVAAVGAVRDRVARQLAIHLGEDATAVVAASMERRPGPEYDFNEPLLERALLEPPCGSGAGDVIVALLFFAPGRHAGPGGDIAAICRRCEERAPGMRVHLTPVIEAHPLLVDILVERFRRITAASTIPRSP